MLRWVLSIVVLATQASASPLLAKATVDCDAGWCRFPGFVPDDKLHAIWSDARDRFWAVGERGLVLRWDGKTLSHQRVGTETLEDVWSDGKDTWVLSRAAASRLRGRTWTTIPLPARARDLVGRDGHAWIVIDGANNGSVLVHVAPDGTQDTQPIANARAVWAASREDIWIAGDRGVLRRSRDGTWKDMQLRTQGGEMSIDGTSASNVWVVAYRSIYRFDGRTWSKPEALPSGGAVRALGGRDALVANRGEYFLVEKGKPAVGGNADGPSAIIGPDRLATFQAGLEIRGIKAATKRHVAIGLPILASAAWGNANGLWIAGGRTGERHKAAVAHWDGRAWKTENLEGGAIAAIGGIDSPWLLGSGGGIPETSKVWRLANGKWIGETVPLDSQADLVVTGAHDAWARGYSATLARRDGGGWSTVKVADVDKITALAVGPDGSVFAAGEKGPYNARTAALFRWTGTAMVKVATLEDAPYTLVVHGAKQVDIPIPFKGVVRWAGSEPLTSIATGPVLNAQRIGSKVYYRADAKTRVDAPEWIRVDYPFQSGTLGVRDGIAWSLRGNDLLVKPLAGVPRETAPAPVAAAPLPAGVIGIPHPSGFTARFQFAVPAGWTGGPPVYTHARGATMTLAIGIAIKQDKPESEAYDALAALPAPPNAIQLRGESLANGAGYLVIHTYRRDGGTRSDVRCMVSRRGGTFAISVHAVGLAESDALAIAGACKASTLL